MIHVAPALLYIAAVFVAGSLPDGPDVPARFEHRDKVFHVIGFAMMQWVVVRALCFLTPGLARVRQARRSALVAIVLGSLLEVWQSTLPTRSAEWLDLVADAVGALLAAWIWFRYGSERGEMTRQQGSEG